MRSYSPASSIVIQHLLLACITCTLYAGPLPPAPWPATDGLGRTLPTFEQTGPVEKDRYVGIFYFIWLGAHSTAGPFDLSQILRESPHAFGPLGSFHHWSKPELGYYYSRDPFVLRRHATQLADAGVDFVALDVTNAVTYEREVKALCDTWLKMREEGNPTPQIIFLANSSHEKVVEKLYREYYQPGLYRPLWFEWKGKPLLMADPAGLPKEITSFFNLRRSWAWSKGQKWFGDGKDRWPWLDNTPQTPGWHDEGKPEEVSVSVAQHPVSNIGRSYQNGVQPPPDRFHSELGLYFQEQWKHALEVDPEVIFVTGWNEWVAQRAIKEAGKPPGNFLGAPLRPGETFFVDTFSAEFSRDIEPMDGGFGDNYYYQLIDNIRRFKGTPPLPGAQAVQTFTDTSCDTPPRNHEGWAKQTLTDDSGRNDITSCTVKKTAQGFSFSVVTREPLTSPADDRWMLLFLDSDGDPKTGWNGYDYVINRARPQPGQATVEKLSRNGQTSPDSVIPATFSENHLEFVLPDLPRGPGRKFVDFHLSDNAPLDSQFYLRGEHAPNRRFNYRFTLQ